VGPEVKSETTKKINQASPLKKLTAAMLRGTLTQIPPLNKIAHTIVWEIFHYCLPVRHLFCLTSTQMHCDLRSPKIGTFARKSSVHEERAVSSSTASAGASIE